MKIRLVDETVYDVERAEVVDGRLEIDMTEKTAEEMQEIFSVPGNLSVIELMTDEGGVFSALPGWTKYGGVMLNGDTKTAILIQPESVTEERLTRAEGDAIEAKTTAQKAEAKTDAQGNTVKEIKEKSNENATQITDLQMALCELYEGMEV